jgi:hypothetical protein
VGLSGFDMVYVQPYALLRSTPARHARLILVLEQNLIADLRPLVCVQKLPAGRTREMTGIGQPEHDSADQVNHALRIHISRRPHIHSSATSHFIDAPLTPDTHNQTRAKPNYFSQTTLFHNC